MQDVTSPSGLIENVAPHIGFVMAITSFLCTALDVAPPLSYAEEIAPPHCIVEDIMSPASYANGITPNEPCQPKGPYKLRDILPGCPRPLLDYILCFGRHALRGCSVMAAPICAELHYQSAPAFHVSLITLTYFFLCLVSSTLQSFSVS